MGRKEIKNFKSSREGKTALRNYCRKILRRYEKVWAEGHTWTDGNGVFHDESILVNRIGIRIVKWDPYFNAAIVCVYDKTILGTTWSSTMCGKWSTVCQIVS